MTLKAVIIQPCFFPWRGQFDLISRSDVCIYLDTVQYVKRSWYNRNMIMTPHGPKWITVPVITKGRYYSLINEIEINNMENWAGKITNSIKHSYARHPFFDEYFQSLKELMLINWTKLADLSESSIKWGFKQLRRKQKFIKASELDVNEQDPVQRLIKLCHACGAKHYISGPSAKNYMPDGKAFAEAGITLEWMSYSYPDYPQTLECKDTPLSILDLLFNTGDKASEYIWGRQ